jgi:hypothetical protein
VEINHFRGGGHFAASVHEQAEHVRVIFKPPQCILRAGFVVVGAVYDYLTRVYTQVPESIVRVIDLQEGFKAVGVPLGLGVLKQAHAHHAHHAHQDEHQHDQAATPK